MVSTRPITVDQFAAIPLDGSWELIDGELVEVSPNAGESGWIAAQIVFLLETHVRAQTSGWVFPPETGFILLHDRAPVRSPDALAKATTYLQAGVQLVWLVDPDRQTVTRFRPDASIDMLRAGDTLDGGDVLPGFSVSVAEIFQAASG